MEKIRADNLWLVIRLEHKPFEVDVPRDVREVEMWFLNSYYTTVFAKPGTADLGRTIGIRWLPADPRQGYWFR